jgi:thiol-disulfide isomerase/thioredoxin
LTRRTISLATVGALVLVVVSCAREVVEKPAANDLTPLAAVHAELEQAESGWNARFPGELTSGQSIERYDSWPGWSFIPRFVELGTADANQPYAFEALKSAVDLSQAVGQADAHYFPCDDTVFTQLSTEQLANPLIIEVFESCARYPTPAREAFLRECVRHGATRDVRGLACFALAECLRTERQIPSHWLEQEQTDSFQKHLADRCSPKFIAFAKSIDPDQALVESKAVYRQVADEFGDVLYPKEMPFVLGKPTLAQVVGFRAAQLDAIAIGRHAPEIVGTDLDGQPRKLSDYEGKVVVLQFWATWCGPCMEKIPQLKQLISKHEGQPFCVVGVNLDRDRDAARKIVKERAISWPSWSALTLDESMGRWEVDGAPLLTVMVLDETGNLRYRGIEGQPLDEAVNLLLREGSKSAE